MHALTSCDTFLARRSAVLGGKTLFAKNSDRPDDERQRYVIVPPRAHPHAAIVRVQYLTIPQVPATYGFIGAQPEWLWGLEHGVNERGVAIGNEAIYTRVPHRETGLLGMDLVRLALERAATAEAAVAVIGSLVERHGIGGSAWQGRHVDYDNAFLITDSKDAWHVETAGRHWVARRIAEDVYAISNEPAIRARWDRASPGLEDFLRRIATARNECADAADAPARDSPQPVEFARAVLDDKRPRGQAACRRARGIELLSQGSLTVRSLMRLLRDHYDGTLLAAWPPEELDIKSICMHSTPYHRVQTSASVVAELDPDGGQPLLWISVGLACRSVFLPYRLPWGQVPTDAGSTQDHASGEDRGSAERHVDPGLWQLVASAMAAATPAQKGAIRRRLDLLEDELLAATRSPGAPLAPAQDELERLVTEALFQRSSGR